MKRWQFLGIGVVAGFAILVSLLVLGHSRLRQVLYPAAPIMPPEVSQPMPIILAELEAVLKTNAPHVLNNLQQGLTAEKISELEKRYGIHLPDDIKSIYQWHNGSPLRTNVLNGDFIPTHRFMPLEEALEEYAGLQKEKATFVRSFAYKIFAGHRDSWIGLFDDGAGDGYWYDLKRKPSEGAIFYNFTETSTYTFFPSAGNLMAGILKCYSVGAFRIKAGSSPPQLDEDFQLSEKVWNEFGASNQQ